jgi:hypothetical protein
MDQKRRIGVRINPYLFIEDFERTWHKKPKRRFFRKRENYLKIHQTKMNPNFLMRKFIGRSDFRKGDKAYYLDQIDKFPVSFVRKESKKEKLPLTLGEFQELPEKRR